jgi:hypothetical protein
MFQSGLRDALSQGDILDGLEIYEEVEGEAITRSIRGVILSHDCDIQPGQKRSKHFLVVEFRKPEEAEEHGLWGLIKKGLPWNVLYIPAGENHGEGFVDFRCIHRLERQAMNDAITENRRLASMTDEGREALVYALTSSLLRQDLVPPTGSPP